MEDAYIEACNSSKPQLEQMWWEIWRVVRENGAAMDFLDNRLYRGVLSAAAPTDQAAYRQTQMYIEAQMRAGAK
jgi:hypothetical protein